MFWNWQLADWPKFHYDPQTTAALERQFLLNFGKATATLSSVKNEEHSQFIVEILSQEAEESSKIEGEWLDRASLRSSIKRHFGMQTEIQVSGKKEAAIAELLCSVYETFNKPLSHELLWSWHSLLFKLDTTSYRTHKEPMQIVSSRLDLPRLYFEAPPSEQVYDEMRAFIDWYNSMPETEPILGRTAIAHLYFENIHPFEDGNGRLGRALIEKMLSQYLGRPTLIAVSKVLEARKKEYYAMLEQCNRSLNATGWVTFFAGAVLQAQAESQTLLEFLLKKTKMLASLSGRINARQEKALVRMFADGPSGFSAENYIAITKASRATTTRDLAELVDFGALRKTGELRHTRYWLNL